jgi:transposase-like protein
LTATRAASVESFVFIVVCLFVCCYTVGNEHTSEQAHKIVRNNTGFRLPWERDLCDKSGMITAADTAPTKPYPRPTQEQKIKARAAYVQGKGSARVVAGLFGLNAETVQDWITDEGWVDMRADYDKRQLEKLLAPPTPAPAIPQEQSSGNRQVDRLSGQMRAIEEQMEGMTNADSLAKLAMAHSKLFDAWCVLTGTPRPGVRKVAKPGRSLAPIVAPTESTAQAVESQPLPE